MAVTTCCNLYCGFSTLAMNKDCNTEPLAVLFICCGAGYYLYVVLPFHALVLYIPNLNSHKGQNICDGRTCALSPMLAFCV